MPPYLAGREDEKREFQRLLEQETILENMVLTGLRGVGKTVLLDTFKPIAIEANWLWAGSDLTEATSLSEERVAIRLLTDLSLVTSSVMISHATAPRIGFDPKVSIESQPLNYDLLLNIFHSVPGLTLDKLKGVLEFTWDCLKTQSQFPRGLIFAYDEAQNMADRTDKDEFPLSLLLDVFQSLQRKGIPFMLVMTGLPTLFPRLVEARTFAERMFRVVFLDGLTQDESRDAIKKPIESSECKIVLSDELIDDIVEISGGYPYFIQFICREVYDVALQKQRNGESLAIQLSEVTRKLDSDFFAGRWAKATDRQRELLQVIANLANANSEFTVQEVVEESKSFLNRAFSSSHVSQMFNTLTNVGLIYKNRHGKYSFAVPLFSEFIKRQDNG